MNNDHFSNRPQKTFRPDPKYVGFLMGKQGKKIRSIAISFQDGVHIRYDDAGGQFVVTGRHQWSVDAAIKKLKEIHQEAHTLPPLEESPLEDQESGGFSSPQNFVGSRGDPGGDSGGFSIVEQSDGGSKAVVVPAGVLSPYKETLYPVWGWGNPRAKLHSESAKLHSESAKDSAKAQCQSSTHTIGLGSAAQIIQIYIPALPDHLKNTFELDHIETKVIWRRLNDVVETQVNGVPVDNLDRKTSVDIPARRPTPGLAHPGIGLLGPHSTSSGAVAGDSTLPVAQPGSMPPLHTPGRVHPGVSPKPAESSPHRPPTKMDNLKLSWAERTESAESESEDDYDYVSVMVESLGREK